MADLVYRCLTNATIAEGDNLRHSPNWLFARRGLLDVYTDRLECGDWVIPYSEIDEAILFRTRQMFIPCYVLRVKAQSQIYQFGLNPGRFWAGELPFAVRRETGSLSYSWLSIAIRAAGVVALVYLLWRWYR